MTLPGYILLFIELYLKLKLCEDNTDNERSCDENLLCQLYQLEVELFRGSQSSHVTIKRPQSVDIVLFRQDAL